MDILCALPNAYWAVFSRTEWIDIACIVNLCLITYKCKKIPFLICGFECIGSYFVIFMPLSEYRGQRMGAGRPQVQE